MIFADPRFRAGVVEFNARNFFEAHEVWEDLWHDLVGEEKNLVQGLIQIAAAYLKLEQGNRSACRKLFEKALARIDAAGDQARQPGVQRLLEVVQRQLADLPRGIEIEAPRFEP